MIIIQSHKLKNLILLAFFVASTFPCSLVHAMGHRKPSSPEEIERFREYDALLKKDENALIELQNQSRKLKNEIRERYGYHTEQVRIKSYEQLIRDYPESARLINVKFVSKSISTQEIKKCLLDKRLSLIENLDLHRTKIDLEDRKELESLILTFTELGYYVSAFSNSGDGQVILAISNFYEKSGPFTTWTHNVKLADLETLQILNLVDMHGDSIQDIHADLSADRKKLLTFQGKRAQILDLSQSAIESTIELDWTISSAYLSDNSTKVLVLSDSGQLARVWNRDTPERLLDIPQPQNTYYGALSHDGKKAVTFSGNFARVYDTNTGTLLYELVGHIDRVTGVAFLADDSRLLTTSDDATARIWDSETGNQMHVLKHEGSVGKFALSADGNRIATSSPAEPFIRLWDAQTGLQLLKLEQDHGEGEKQMAFSRDGKMILGVFPVSGFFGPRSIQVWDARTGAAICNFNQFIRNVDFSPDGKKIYFNSGGKLKSINIKGKLRTYAATLPRNPIE